MMIASRFAACQAIGGAGRLGRSVELGELLAGQTAFVTGAARGLGLAVAQRFAAEGAVGLRGDLEAALGGAPDVEGFALRPCDVTDEGSVRAAMAAAAERFGRLDCVVANAGIVPPWRESEALDIAEIERVLAVNAAGVAATIKQAVPFLKERGGTIVVMGSINSVKAHPRQLAYTASKHAVLGIVRAAALDLGRFGIRVNAVAPGPIATEALMERIRFRAQTGPSEEEALRGLAKQTALERLATADEVAKAVAFLASDLSSGITGEILPVDAGMP